LPKRFRRRKARSLGVLEPAASYTRFAELDEGGACMSRILWFSLGAMAGAAYASRVINTERLDLAVGESRPVSQAKNALTDYKDQLQDYTHQLADMVETRTHRMGELISDRGQVMAEQIRHISFLEDGQAEGKTKEVDQPRVDSATPTTVGVRTGEQPL
jgi:hypothetical protein